MSKQKKSTKPAPVASSIPVAPPASAPAQSPTANATACNTGGAVTTIEVKVDVGFGNSVFLRGNGAGLTWERGIRMACVDGTTWRWSGMIKHPLTFKPVLNDTAWADGEDLKVSPGQKLELKPKF